MPPINRYSSPSNGSDVLSILGAFSCIVGQAGCTVATDVSRQKLKRPLTSCQAQVDLFCYYDLSCMGFTRKYINLDRQYFLTDSTSATKEIFFMLLS